MFEGLEWTSDSDPRRSHLERAEAEFQFVIRDVSCGSFVLRLTHDSRTDSPAYRQRNSLTQVHWGAARELIAREDLLDRTMFLYRYGDGVPRFVAEID